MDWTRAIEINREALARIVGALVALLQAQVSGPGGALRLALPVYQLIARILLPAESATRRLIVVMSRGLVVSSVSGQPARPMPRGLIIVRKGSRGSFQLFDTRKRFSADDGDRDDAQPITGPRIRIVGDPSPQDVILSQLAKPAKLLSSEAETAQISNRLMILAQALDTLPHQARRMVRWLKRRALMKNPKFTSPLRPGAPPGLRKRQRDDIDHVLAECHGLAWNALNLNSS